MLLPGARADQRTEKGQWLEANGTGWRLRKIAESLIICTHAQTPEAILAGKTIPRHDLQRCEDFGETLGQGLVMGLF